jgi:hypothetical protein
MLRIQRTEGGEIVFTLSGRIHLEDVAELKTLFGSEEKNRPVVLDLKDLTLVDRDAVGFLARCEADGFKLTNCSAYVREWITRERHGNEQHP